jgi:hypothetical protein
VPRLTSTRRVASDFESQLFFAFHSLALAQILAQNPNIKAVSSYDIGHAGVAEWQTRWTQNPEISDFI